MHAPELLDATLKLIFGVLAVLVTAYTPSLIALLRARITNTTAREALAVVVTTVANAVAARAEMVRGLKDDKKPELGHWSPAVAQQVLHDALNDVKRNVPAQVATLERGLAAGQSIDATLRGIAEAQVEELRRRSPVGLSIGVDTAAARVEVTAGLDGASGTVAGGAS